jgi:TRAP-type C4-dicarboxylate transport system substrate-binding protein
VQKYVSKTGHGFGPEVLLVSMATWNGLTPEQQKIVQDCADEAKVWQRALCVKLEKEYWEKLAGTSMQINEVTDREAFRKACMKVWKALEPKAGKENIQKILDAQE